MYALIDSNKLAGVGADMRTYLADTSGDMAFRDNNFTIYTTERNNCINKKVSSLFPNALTWDLEKLKLMG